MSLKNENNKKHRIAWENEDWAKGWLKSIAHAPREFQGKSCNNCSWCAVCMVALQSQKNDLRRHAESAKHSSKMKLLNPSNTLETYGVVSATNETKLLDIRLAVFVAKHSSITSVDHLTNLMKSFSIKDNPFENLRLHRTKCSAIIKHVVAPVILSELVKSVGDNKYSLIVDESTDISNNKWMSICIRYFNEMKSQITTDFLGIFLVEEATANKLHEGLMNYLKNTGLSQKNMLAIGTDGANNLCGRKNSLYTHLKMDNPNLMLIKCTCHSIHLCCSEASKQFPPDIEFLVRETFNYFSNSPLRTIKYKRAFNLINTGTDSYKFKQLVQISSPRWLSYGFAVKRILEQWVELKYHFSIISTAEAEKTAELIYHIMCKEENKLYLLFISPILNDMNRLNLDFQSDKMDGGTMYEKLHVTLLSLAARMLKPAVVAYLQNEDDIEKVKKSMDTDSGFLPLEVIDFGFEFEEEIKSLPEFETQNLKKTCFSYLKSLLLQMLQRFPPNLLFFKTFKQFSINICCNPVGQPSFGSILPILRPVLREGVPTDLYESEWRKMPFVNWKNIFRDDIITNLNSAWPKIYSYQDAAGNQPFKELAEMVLNMLCVPTSNACVERVFSIMNTTKTKIRNKIQYELLEALLRINTHFKTNSICCDKYNPSPEMLKRFNSHNMYKNVTKGDDIECLESEVFNIINID